MPGTFDQQIGEIVAQAGHDLRVEARRRINEPLTYRSFLTRRNDDLCYVYGRIVLGEIDDRLPNGAKANEGNAFWHRRHQEPAPTVSGSLTGGPANAVLNLPMASMSTSIMNGPV